MEEKDRYLFLEILFTFILLEALIFLFGDIFALYRVYFTVSLIAGLSFGWFNRKRLPYVTVIIINLLVLGVFGWIVYSLLNSSLLYREVLGIFIIGGFILEAAFSFGACTPPFLSYAQALSLPLFLCFPVFVKDYNIINGALVLGYIICWISILRIKFYGFLTPKALRVEKQRQRLPLFISAGLFLIIISISWVLFYRILLGKIEKEGFLLEERKQAEVDTQTLEKEYYASQDKVQDELSELILKLDSREKRQEMLLLLSALIKDTSIVAEVQKAESALINRLKVPGPGIEKAKGTDIAIQIKDYMDKKVPFKLLNLREETIKNLKKNRFNIMDRFSVTSRINRLQGADSKKGIEKYSRQLKQAVNKASARGAAKKDMRRLTRQLGEWKAFDIYRRKTDSLNKKIDSLGERLRKKFKDLLSDIDSIENLQGIKEAEENIGKLKEETPAEHEDIIKETEEILGLKEDMLLSRKAKEAKDKIEEMSLPRNESEELKEKIDDIKDAQDRKEFSESMEKYREKLRENRLKEDKETKELARMKAHLLFRDKKEGVKDALKESNLADKGEKLIKDLEKLESDKSEELVSGSKELKDDIERLSNEGFIPKKLKDNLKKEIDEVKELFRAEKGTEKEATRKEPSEKEGQSDYRDKWEKLIEESSLKKEKKEALKQLGQELFKSETISQVENVKEATHEVIEKLPLDGVKEEESDKIKDAFDSMVEIKSKLITEKSLAALRDKIEDLKKVDPREAEKLERFLEKIRDSRTNEELKEQIKALKDYLDSKRQEEATRKEPSEKEGQSDYRDKWEKLIEESSLKKEKKEALKQLGQELFKSETISQVENVKEATHEVIEKLPLDGVKEEESDKIKDAFDSMVEIKSKLITEKSLAAKDEAEEKKDEVKEKKDEAEEKKPEEIKEKGDLEISLLPSQLIIPAASSASLKALAVYNRGFIKDATSEMTWYSARPYVAWVDDRGTVHAIAKGTTEIYATYAGKESQKIEVTVLERIDEQTGKIAESESIR